ncbi:MAG: NUDIX hydrolase [Opitutales bacterium]|nr:NUDIX hydrolase [Opitutales bacterium]
MPSRWHVERDEFHADCGPFSIRRRHCVHADDRRRGDFYIIDVADWVVAVALTPDGEIVLVRQFRFGVNDFTWELPAGLIDPGETPAAAAVRELEEETGHVGRVGHSLGVLHPNPALQANRCHFVLIRDAVPHGEIGGDPNEETAARTVTLPEFRAWIREGRVTHALAVAAVALLDDRGVD